MSNNIKGNPFKYAITIDPKQLLETAVGRSLKLSLPKIKTSKTERLRILLLNRIRYIEKNLVTNLLEFLRRIPDLDNTHEFYRAAVDVYFSIDEFKKTLGRISGTIRVIEKLSEEYLRNIRGIKVNIYLPETFFVRHLKKLWRQYLARMNSFIYEISEAFDYLNSAIKKLKALPDYNPELETIIVCGPPNSGKSSLVGKLSNARVQIAEYPFTTKNVVFGHIKLRSRFEKTIQIVDTPGLFDRPLGDRKKEELLTLQSIRTIANGVIFLFDCSVERTLSAEQQIRIYQEVTSFLRNSKIIAGLNKIDIMDEKVYNAIYDFITRDINIKPIPLSIKQSIGLDQILSEIERLFG
ncbi:MAG: 50S ribosome-binding GTPase [Crenarchaeota archaeon]|nr:50S ribosome-binding GTPase [Thermoproteota archaeon]